LNVREELRNRKNDAYALVILLIILILIFASVFYEYRAEHDLGSSAARAKRYASGGQLESPHFLYQGLIIFVHSLFPFIGFFSSGVLVIVASFIILGLILYFYLRPIMGERQSFTSSFITLVLVLVLLVVAPITFFTWKYSNLYFGYLTPSVYHNATINLIKPFSLLLFIIALKIFHWKAEKKNGWTFFLMALLVFLSAIAKPSYLICFLPALGIFSIYRYFSKRELNWKLLIFGAMIPGAIALGIQFFIAYVPGIDLIDYPGGGIEFAPLKVMSYLSSWLFPKFLLSILFPLCVYISYYKEAKQNTELSISWLTFCFGVFYSYMLAESIRPYHGNFLWSGHISLLILFITSLKFFILQIKESDQLNVRSDFSTKSILNLCVLAFHFICGIPWYFVHLIGNGNFM
jgi:hypothetical protein